MDKKKQSLQKEQIEFKEWLDKNRYINRLNPINNYWFSPIYKSLKMSPITVLTIVIAVATAVKEVLNDDEK